MNKLLKQKMKLQDFILSFSSSSNNGVGSFKQMQEDQFQDLPVTQVQSDEFQLQAQQVQPENSIKNASFNTFINVGAQKYKNNKKNTPQLSIIDYSYVYGFNRGTNTVEVIKGKICRAVGVNIFFDDQIYPIQGDTKEIEIHNYSICYLKYHRDAYILESCSFGKSGEIIHWKVTEEGQKLYLSFIRKLLLPLNSQQISFTHITKQSLICITKYGLHIQSDLFLFSLQTKKRLRLNKVGKATNFIANKDRLYLINQNGLNTIQIKDQTYSIINIYQPNSIITSSTLINTQCIVLGLSNNIIQLFNLNSNKKIISHQLKQQNIAICLKSHTSNKFISLQFNNTLNLYELVQSENKINHLHQITLEQNNKTFLLIHQNTIFSCYQSGKIEQFTINKNKLVLANKQQKLKDLSYNGNNGKDNEQILIYKSNKKRVYYGMKHSNVFDILELDQKGKIAKVTSINVKSKVLIADFHSTFVAYITRQPLNYLKKSSIEFKHKKDKIKNTSFLKLEKDIQYQYFLVLEDYLINKVICNKQLKCQCTQIKYCPDGSKLALGFSNGKIEIYNTMPSNKAAQTICQSNKEKIQTFNHTKNIQSIIWCSDGKYLKTISFDKLLFYGLEVNKKQEYQLLVYHNNKKMVQNEALNAAVQKAQWTQMGKYSWKTAKLWKKANEIGQYKCLKQSTKYIFVCNQNGDMQIFNNPSIDNQQPALLKRWFYGNYKCQIIQIEVNKICLIVYGQGILFNVNLEQFQEVQ